MRRQKTLSSPGLAAGRARPRRRRLRRRREQEAACRARATQSCTARRAGRSPSSRTGTSTISTPAPPYYQYTYAITYVTQRPLLAYKPNSITPVPDLAASMPTVSNGGKTVTVHIRKGIKFSPPVNREVTSADVKYAMERGFDAAVGNGYASPYFGVSRERRRSQQHGAEHLRHPDAGQVHDRVQADEAERHVRRRAPGAATPRPGRHARKYDKGASSSYGNHQVATGPYMIQNNAAGKITGYTPGRQIVLVRNPNWNAKTSWRPAYADKIVFKEGFDPTVGTKQILSGPAGHQRRLPAAGG